MTQISDKRGSGCPVAFALDTFGDKWTLLIIRDLIVHGKRTYSAFMAADEGISSNILVSRLKQLEADGIVTRQRDKDNHRSFVYDLTPKGYDLAPVLIEIIRWSGAHDSRPSATKELARAADQDQSALEIRLRKPLDQRALPV
jgi:DNA-binding HxlR family transcriptional regulator